MTHFPTVNQAQEDIKEILHQTKFNNYLKNFEQKNDELQNDIYDFFGNRGNRSFHSKKETEIKESTKMIHSKKFETELKESTRKVPTSQACSEDMDTCKHYDVDVFKFKCNTC